MSIITDHEKIVETLKGEDVFNEQWAKFKLAVAAIAKDTTCTKKMILAFESFFTQVYKDFIYFLPVSAGFFAGKLNDIKALTDANTLIGIN